MFVGIIYLYFSLLTFEEGHHVILVWSPNNNSINYLGTYKEVMKITPNTDKICLKYPIS
jgi:hypothetical protein